MKHIKCANYGEAHAKSCAVRNTRHPNWYPAQLALHQANPGKCLHPDTYVNEPFHGIRVSQATGEAEIDVPFGEDQFYPQEDRNKMTDSPQIEDDQGEQ